MLPTILLLLVTVTCSSRPDEAEMERLFISRNAGVDEVQVEIDEDEVAARTYVITYKSLKTGKRYKQTWVYFDKNSWTQYPPEEL